eukprot:6029840-Alexandrium_andersonii.AAC.1
MPVRTSATCTADPGDLPELRGIALSEWNLQRETNVQHRYRKACFILHPDKRVLVPDAAKEGVAEMFSVRQRVRDITNTYFDDMK